jgi:hypothetical protein
LGLLPNALSYFLLGDKHLGLMAASTDIGLKQGILTPKGWHNYRK